ncbi:MAG: hypothetical protein ABI673_09520 [Novosphingobium sp.]
MGIDFSNDVKGTHVFTESDKTDEEFPFPWGFVGALAAIAISFLVGIGVGASWISGELKKRGIDADALMKQTVPLPKPPETSA